MGCDRFVVAYLHIERTLAFRSIGAVVKDQATYIGERKDRCGTCIFISITAGHLNSGIHIALGRLLAFGVVGACHIAYPTVSTRHLHRADFRRPLLVIERVGGLRGE